MDKKEILQTLQIFGLNEKEAKTYFVSLELGLAKVNEISKKSGVIRETTYSIIDSLLRKGLLSYVIKSGIKYFEAADPKKLKSILQEKEKLIDKILPNLEILNKMKTIKPKIGLYEGKEGIKTIMEDILQTKEKEILIIASNKNLSEILRFYFPNFVKKRIKLGIRIKLLTDKKVLTKQLIKYKYLPKEFKFKTANYIYANKIVIISLSQKEPIGILIEDKEIADAQKNFFNLLWHLLKRS